MICLHPQSLQGKAAYSRVPLGSIIFMQIQEEASLGVNGIYISTETLQDFQENVGARFFFHPHPLTAKPARRSGILAAKRQAEKSTGEVFPSTAESPHQENPHLLNCTSTLVKDPRRKLALVANPRWGPPTHATSNPGSFFLPAERRRSGSRSWAPPKLPLGPGSSKLYPRIEDS